MPQVRTRLLLGAVALLAPLAVVTHPPAAVLASASSTQSGRDAYDWHVLVAGPERIALGAERSGRVVLRGANPSGLPIADWNRRQVLTRSGGAESTDQQVCATWRSQSTDGVQQGLAVRVHGGTSGGRQRAITLTKNTFAGYYWVFNLLSWDSRRPGDPWREVGQFDLGEVLVRDGHWLPLPWRVCLRADGRTVSFKVWLPREEPEPPWDDQAHVRQARVPARFVMRGRPGWYVGHLPAGQEISYTGLSTTPS